MTLLGSLSHCIAFFIILLVVIDPVRGHNSWSYDLANGPRTWAKTWPDCGGKMQSPVDIQTKDAKYDGFLKDLDIQYRNPTAVMLFNHGVAVQANVLSDGLSISGADLGFRYNLKQFHFHWGSINTQGSEHLINSGKYPMEMHLVHYNADKYPNFTTAMQKPGGLAVISVLFELKSAENPGLNQIVANLKNVSYKEYKIVLQSVSVKDLFPSDTSKFYRYNGSLTTPGCFETVKWIVLKQPTSVSQTQLDKFRSVFASTKQDTKHKPLVDNFRPTLALNGRTIRKNFDQPPFSCGKKSNFTADCRQLIDGKEVFYEVVVHPCTLPVSVTLKVNVPGVFNSVTTVSEDIKSPIKIWSFDYGASMEMHYHPLGAYAGQMHITVYQVPLPPNPGSEKVKVMDEYFPVAGVCHPANCTIDTWDKHWCTATIGYLNDTLDLGFSSIVNDQCSRSSPSIRVKIYRQESRWVWAAQETFKNNDIKEVGLTGSILHDSSIMKRSTVNTRWSPIMIEAFLTHEEGTYINFSLYMVKKDIGGRYLILKDHYTYPKSICSPSGGSSTSRKVAIGVSVFLVVVLMIAVTVGLIYRKRRMFIGHRPALVDEIDIQDADQL